jgi:hypothetical protein
MGELGLPVWGVGTLVGLPLTALIFIFVRYIQGEIVSRKQLEDKQKVADSWQHAWEVSQETNHAATDLLKQLTVTAQTMEKVLQALPPVSGLGAETRSEEDSE